MRSARKGVKTEREVHEEHPGSFNGENSGKRGRTSKGY